MLVASRSSPEALRRSRYRLVGHLHPVHKAKLEKLSLREWTWGKPGEAGRCPFRMQDLHIALLKDCWGKKRALSGRTQTLGLQH